MADSGVIKEFLVSLGWKIDTAGEKKFTDTMGSATVKAVALGAAITATATAVVAGVARIADGLEQLYFASQRTNSSVENLQATGFAARQMGVDAASALGSVESLARFLRNSPGGEGLLKNIGVNTRDSNGAMRDTVDLLGDLGKQFAAMPYYKANAYAQALGIDEKTLMAMRQGMGQFQNEYKNMLHAAGVDSQAAAKSSHEFMNQLRLFGASFQILTMKIAASLTGPLGDSLRRLRESLVANFDWIAASITFVIDVFSRVIAAATLLTVRMVGWFQQLTPETKMLIAGVMGIAAAWKVLNLVMALSPIGLIVAAGLAISALIDDFQTWKEGGKSLIDWSDWAPGIEAAIKGLEAIRQWLVDATEKLIEFGADLPGAITGLIDKAGDAAARLGAAIVKRFKDAVSLGKAVRDQFGQWFGGATSPVAAAAPAQAAAVQQAAHAAVAAVEKIMRPTSGPRGLRNFNPGNINYGAFARAHGATGIEAGPGGRFATFGSAQDGLNALADLLRSYMGRGIDSVRAIISRYAPASDKNNTEAYIASVSKRLGVDANQHLDPRDIQQMAGIVDAIVRVENGKNPYSREMIERAAGGGAAPALTQTTTIHVNGAGDTKGVARDVANAQNDVNQQVFRNMRGATF